MRIRDDSYRPLTAEEEKALVAKMQEGCLESRDTLLNSVLPWILTIVRRFCENTGWREIEELEQEAILKVIEKILPAFNPEKGRLTTLVSFDLFRFLPSITSKHKVITTPRDTGGKSFRYNEEADRASAIAHLQYDASVDDLHKDTPFNYHGRHDPDLAKILDNRYTVMEIHNAMDTLTSRQFFVIEKRFFMNLTFGEIGSLIGVSRERVRQILKDGLDKMGEELENLRASSEPILDKPHQ